MANTIIPNGEQQSAPEKYSEFSNSISYELHLIRYKVKAARTFLHKYKHSASSEKLSGVNYLLSDIAKACAELEETVSQGACAYVVKEVTV